MSLRLSGFGIDLGLRIGISRKQHLSRSQLLTLLSIDQADDVDAPHARDRDRPPILEHPENGPGTADNEKPDCLVRTHSGTSVLLKTAASAPGVPREGLTLRAFATHPLAPASLLLCAMTASIASGAPGIGWASTGGLPATANRAPSEALTAQWRLPRPCGGEQGRDRCCRPVCRWASHRRTDLIIGAMSVLRNSESASPPACVS